MTTLTPVETAPTFALIIRATWESGEPQVEAIREIDRRGCWLSEEQLVQARMDLARYRAICGRDTNTGAKVAA